MASNIKIVSNCAMVSVNPKLYPLEVIYSASYVMLDRAYIILTGNPEKEVIVEIESKDKGDAAALGKEFNDQLLNYANYHSMSKKNIEIKKMLLEEVFKQPMQEQKVHKKIDDPEGILIPWEEKYGKRKT
jgi:His-Xaa-Ser system protein HxsD